MASNEVKPWGTRPTPLLPKVLSEKLEHLSAPAELKDILGVNATFASLNGELWNRVDTVSKVLLREIVRVVRLRLPALQHLAIRPDNPLVMPIQSLPFSTRTRNAVCANLNRFSSPQLTFRDALMVPNFGIRSVIEFACVVEAAAHPSKQESSKQLPSGSVSATRSDLSDIVSVFQVLAAYAAGERNLGTLADVIPPVLDEWPPEIGQLWSGLGGIGTRQLAGSLAERYSISSLISRGLSPIDLRSREILVQRVFATDHAITLEVLGKRHGVTRERVRQLEKKAIQRLNIFHSAEFRPVIRRSIALRERLGIAIPAGDPVIQHELAWATSDLDISDVNILFVQSFLLWLAGPYRVRQYWLLAERKLSRLTSDALLVERNERGLISEVAATEVMIRLGLKEQHHVAWIEHLPGFSRVDGGFIYLKGNVVEKARVLIRYRDRPLTADEMLRYIGTGSVRSLRQRLIDDPGFWRINKQSQFVLANTPGYDEYTSITDEIVQELEVCGGQAHIRHLVEKITNAYGVRENSVIAFVNTPMFTKDESGNVRIRDADERIEVATDITRTAACYRADDGTWYWRVLVDKDVVRGSGLPIPNAFAQILGCEIGNRVQIQSDLGAISVSWLLTSTGGASIGSLRRVLKHSGAELGDYLFVKASKPNVSFKCLKRKALEQTSSSIMRLSLLLGCVSASDDAEAIAGIANVLGVSQLSDEDRRMESRRRLQSRGEAELAEMIPPAILSVDDHISKMKALFDR